MVLIILKNILNKEYSIKQSELSDISFADVTIVGIVSTTALENNDEQIVFVGPNTVSNIREGLYFEFTNITVTANNVTFPYSGGFRIDNDLAKAILI